MKKIMDVIYDSLKKISKMEDKNFGFIFVLDHISKLPLQILNEIGVPFIETCICRLCKFKMGTRHYYFAQSVYIRMENILMCELA